MSSFKSLLLPGLLAFALSCSVKEDRSQCMCCLGLDYSECIDNNDRLVLIGWDGGLSESFRSAPLQEISGSYCEYYVPRGEFTLSASVGADITDGKYVMVRSGLQADSLYACVDRFLTDSEYCFRKVQLNKQFTTVRIITYNSDYSDDDIIVKGSTIGISLSDMSPISGEFICAADKLSDGIYSFRLYRQSGDVTVSIDPLKPGVRTRMINLSDLLEECGYDWTETSLRDVDLYLNRSMTYVSVQVSGWNYKETIYLEL